MATKPAKQSRLQIEREIAEIEKQLEVAKKLAPPPPEEWIPGNIMIEDPQSKSRILPFTLWPSQIQFLRDIVAFNQVVTLKSRQLGITWVVLAYCIYLCEWYPGTVIILMSKDGDASKEMIRRCDGMFERLPNSKNKFVEPHNKETITLNNGSRIKSFSTTGTSGASYTGTLVFLDEFGLVEDAEVLLSTIKPVIDDGGRIIISSTMDDRTGGPFKALFESAMLGLNRFKHIFLPWSARISRSQDWYDEKLRDAQSQGPTALARFRQQYPASIDEAFQVIESQPFVSPEVWAACADMAWSGVITEGVCPNGCRWQTWLADKFDRSSVVAAALDGSVKHDTTAIGVVGRYPGDITRYAIYALYLWFPTEETPIHFKSVEDTCEGIWRNHAVQKFVYDQTQLADLAQRVTERGVPLEAFSQKDRRLVSDTTLRNIVMTRRLVHPNIAQLNLQMSGAIARPQRDDRVRIDKASGSKKIDAIVAMSMALDEAIKITTTTQPAGVSLGQRNIIMRPGSAFINAKAFDALPKKIGF